MVDAYQQAALGTRLGIPILYGVDAVHGQSHVVGATIFPHQVGLGATHDAALVEQVGRATALETSATGIRWTFGPVVAVPAGRALGPDLRGLRRRTRTSSPSSARRSSAGSRARTSRHDDAVAATAKHFIGDGGTVWGTSDAPRRTRSTAA